MCTPTAAICTRAVAQNLVALTANSLACCADVCFGSDPGLHQDGVETSRAAILKVGFVHSKRHEQDVPSQTYLLAAQSCVAEAGSRVSEEVMRQLRALVREGCQVAECMLKPPSHCHHLLPLVVMEHSGALPEQAALWRNVCQVSTSSQRIFAQP